MYLICHMTSHDHLLKDSCKFMCEDSLWYVITLISLVTISIVKVEICFNLWCDLFKDLCEFMGGSLLRSVTTLPCLMAIGQVQAEIQILKYVK